jgi:hypothetical protein
MRPRVGDLRKLAATGEPLQRVLERAVENDRRRQFYAGFNAAFRICEGHSPR